MNQFQTAKMQQAAAESYYRQSTLSKSLGQISEAIKYQRESAKTSAAARWLMGIED